MRARNLSQQGRELFLSGLSMTSEKGQLSPRSERLNRPSRNVFAALDGGESDEEEGAEDFEDEKEEEEEEKITHPSSPRTKPVSPKLQSNPNGESKSPRWEVYTTRKPPKMHLDSEPVVPIAIVPPPPALTSTRSIGEDIGDISMIASLTMDTKGRRDLQRSFHGSKANRFKAMKQRLDSMAKRDDQREAARAAKGGSYFEEEPEDW